MQFLSSLKHEEMKRFSVICPKHTGRKLEKEDFLVFFHTLFNREAAFQSVGCFLTLFLFEICLLNTFDSEQMLFTTTSDNSHILISHIVFLKQAKMSTYIELPPHMQFFVSAGNLTR